MSFALSKEMPTFAPVNLRTWFYHRPMQQPICRLWAARDVGHPTEPQVERGDEQFGFRVGCSFFIT